MEGLVVLLLAFALLWGLGFGVACHWVAEQRGRDPLVWGALGVLLGVFALLMLVAVPEVRPQEGE